MTERRGFGRMDELLADREWPGLARVDGVAVSGHDAVVVCAGFEDRATTVLDMMVRGGNRRFRVVVVEYAPHYEENRRAAVAEICRRGELRVTWVRYDRCAPAEVGESIEASIGDADRVFVDVSAMSRMLIVQLVVAFGRRRAGLAGIEILYTEARDYPPSEREYEEDRMGGGIDANRVDSYISTGVWELAAVPELSAPTAQAEALRLIVFPSFNPAQLRLLVQELQPTFVDLVNGVPRRGENAWRPDAIELCNAGAVKGLRSVASYRVSTLDYRETLRLVLGLYGERSAFDKLVVAPTGSKMQSVGIGISRSFLDDIQIVYPTPQKFLEPRRHTVGARDVYRLDLGCFEVAGGRDGARLEDL